MFGRLAAAVSALLTALLLVSGCSSGGRAHEGPPTFPGLSSIGPSLGVPVPNGIAGVSGSTSGKPTPAKTSDSDGRSSSGVATAGGHGAPAPGQSTTRAGVSRTSTARPTPPPPPSGPRVSVNPASGLRGGQSVQVVVTGFAANTLIKIFECRAGVTCTRLARLYRFSTDAAGRASATVIVSSRIGINSCGNDCLISVRPATGSGGSAPISFA